MKKPWRISFRRQPAGDVAASAADEQPDNRASKQLSRRTLVTWLPNSFLMKSLAPAGTFCLTTGCSSDFRRVRVGMPSLGPAPFAFDRIAIRASDSWNDYFNPIGTGQVCMLRAAPAVRDLDMDRDAEGQILVSSGPNRENDSRPLVAKWTWTEWVDIASGAPDPATDMRVLMVRGHSSSPQPLTFANGQFEDHRNRPDITCGFEHWIGGINNGRDLTDFSYMDAATLLSNNPVNGTPFAAVQFDTLVAGIVGYTTGDSHQSGTTTQSQFNSFLIQYMSRLGQELVGLIPVGIATDACGGLRSDEFFAKTDALLDEVRPSFVVLPGCSYNDHVGQESAAEVNAQFLLRLEGAARRAATTGATVMFLTPFPFGASRLTPELLASWRDCRAAIMARADLGEIVIDAAAILGTITHGELDCSYRPDLTTDGIHPNDFGHAALADALDAALRPRVGAISSRSV